MKVSNVSFGKVIAVSGKESKIKKLNDRLSYRKQNGLVAMRDVTKYYQYAPSTGSLAQAAQRGNKIEIYITGDDVKKINRDPDWKTMDGILSHLSAYIDLAKTSIGEAIEKISKS